MSWILASILMFLSSVALYLLVRRSNLLKTPQQLNNLAMFLIPVIVYLLFMVNKNISFSLKPFEFFIILVQGIFFSYLGNLLSLKGIAAAPNPGYSLIISKSYVVFTTIVSIFIFGASLNIKSVMAILMIVIFSTLIMMDRGQKNYLQINCGYSILLVHFFAGVCWL